MSAFDSTFRAAIPGQSLALKMGSLPHQKPPKFVDPNEALEYFWKLFHRKDVLKQIWQLMESGVTSWAITRAVLYKAALEGVIALNLAMVIYNTVGGMVTTIGKAKGIDVKVYPKFRDKIKDKFQNDDINKKLGRTSGTAIPPSALKSTVLPKPEEITKRVQANTGSTAGTGQPVQEDKAAGLLNQIQASKGQV